MTSSREPRSIEDRIRDFRAVYRPGMSVREVGDAMGIAHSYAHRIGVLVGAVFDNKPGVRENIERNDAIVAMRLEGKKMREIGECFGISAVAVFHALARRGYAGAAPNRKAPDEVPADLADEYFDLIAEGVPQQMAMAQIRMLMRGEVA